MTAPPARAVRVLLIDGGWGLSSELRPLFDDPKLLVPSGPGCVYAEAVQVASAQHPDVIVIELQAKSVPPIAAIEALMAQRPTPILAVYRGEGARAAAFTALELGVLDVAALPAARAPEAFGGLVRQLLLLAQVRVVQHVRGMRKHRPPSHAREAVQVSPRFPLLAIASSLGGPRALSSILSALPGSFPAAVVVCQHITVGFTKDLASWLDHASALKVTEAVDRQPIVPGSVYLAPSNRHLRVDAAGFLRLDAGEPIGGFRPSCDALLGSVATAYGTRAVGLILTGMGRDGATGLKAIKDHGGRTLAQDEASCVVFGMPREAVALGAVDQVLALSDIAPALLKLVGGEPC